MLVAVGVCFEVAATMVGTAGKQLVSYSARAGSKRKARALKFAGIFVTTLIGPILDMTAYAFAPQAIIAPLNGLDIVWNTISAPFTLGERLSWRHGVGSSLVFVGAVCTSLTGPHQAAQETLEWMHHTFISLRFVSFVATFGGLMVLGAVTLSARPKGVGDKLRGVALAAMAGGIAGNMYFVSAGLGLLRSSFETGDWSAWAHWIPYPVLLGGVTVAVANIPLMTKALQEFNALFVVTLFEGSHIVVACVSGSWVLKELDGYPLWRRALYWACVLVIFSGLWIIRSTATSNRSLSARSDELQEGEQSFAGARSCSEAERGPHDAEQDAAERQLGEHRQMSKGGANESDEVSPMDTDETAGGVVVWAGHISGIGSATFVAEDSDSDASSESDDASSIDEANNLDHSSWVACI